MLETVSLLQVCTRSLFLLVSLLFVSRKPGWGYQERDQHGCGRSCNGEEEDVLDASHICLEHNSELLSAEILAEAGRASLADPHGADLWSGGCDPLIHGVREEGLRCRVEVSAADGLARYPKWLAGIYTETAPRADLLKMIPTVAATSVGLAKACSTVTGAWLPRPTPNPNGICAPTYQAFDVLTSIS
jgi:hypothetical protein